MEKFSNSREEYWNQIITELLDECKGERIVFRFLEMGQLLSHGYSITQTVNEPDRLFVKKWNAEFDNKRFDKGIYNLDRLAISESLIHLDPYESDKIKKSLNSEIKLTDWGGIVLDGLFCQLETDDLKINWNCNEEINEPTVELVEFLRNKVN